MKIYCDFCGSQIETNENKTCPHCGGYYSHDKELLEERERVKKLNELEMEKQQLDLERMKRENQKNVLFNLSDPNMKNRGAKGCLFGVITALCIFGVFFVLMMVCVFMDSSAEASSKEKSDSAALHTTASINYTLKPVEVPKLPEIPEINMDDFINNF